MFMDDVVCRSSAGIHGETKAGQSAHVSSSSSAKTQFSVYGVFV